jgi:RNA polymerase sigma-70 factor (ECF subfamily)
VVLRDKNEPPPSRESLDAWVRATWPRAVVYARSLLSNRPWAEDVVQDCYCNLLRKADVYDLPRDGLRLLMKSISNACMRKNMRDRRMLSMSIFASESSDERPMDPLDDCAPEPPHVMLHAELEQAIGVALDRLPQAQRAAVELKAFGHSLQEIADILDVTPTNAGVLVYRGRQELARQLAPFLEEQAG